MFFLTRAELDGQRDSSEAVAERVANRQRTWEPQEPQRRLVAPLDLGTPQGTPPRAIRSLVHGATETARTEAVRTEAARIKPVSPDAVLVGEPASPGRASGAVRIVRGPEDFSSFRDGEVLVARLTAPAWTPLFGRAAAVVTDGGTLAATPPSWPASTASPRW